MNIQFMLGLTVWMVEPRQKMTVKVDIISRIKQEIGG
jgi:hypothetical protein